MTAHIHFKNIDPDWPVTLSKKFVNDFLKEELRYRNLVITDDLGMQALASHHDTSFIPVKALQAGCDMLLYCNEFDSPAIALEAIEKALGDKKLDAMQIDQSYQKIIAAKEKYLKEQKTLDFQDAKKIIGCEEHQKLAQAFRDGTPIEV